MLPRITIVTPSYNQAAYIESTLISIHAQNYPQTEHIVIDGGSTDGTVAAARAARPDLRVVTELRPGKGAALRRGWEEATGDIIVTIDADGSTDPGEIPAFVGLLLAGADLAKGSRFLHGGGTDDMGALRRSGNWALTRVVRVLYGGRYSDLCYGYNAFWRHVTPCFDGEADGFEIETFINVRALRHGLQVAEVPSFERSRIHGQSNLRTFADGWRVLKTIVREQDRARARAVWLGGVTATSVAFGTVGVTTGVLG
ncbi:MAG TPA: glycosyltransferase family 2 protein [Acidimicrobiales bacterium]|nr:glycosyltransferase family 2 protein [Acidimicrobiales bacterium]